MPYKLIYAGDTIKVEESGRLGIVIALGNPANRSAHYLVRFTPEEVEWYSREEVELVSRGSESGN